MRPSDRSTPRRPARQSAQPLDPRIGPNPPSSIDAASPLERAVLLSLEIEEDRAPDPPRSRRWSWRLYATVWTVVGIVFAIPEVIDGLVQGNGVPWTSAASELLRWYLWALLTPLIWWLAQRFPIERRRLGLSLLTNLGLGLVLTLIYVFLDLVKRQIIRMFSETGGGEPLTIGAASSWLEQLVWGVQHHLLTSFFIVAVIHAFRFYGKFHEREVKASWLEAQLAHTRLEVLKTQLHPHFLFNTLNAVSALMHRDVNAADRMITLLSDLLRLALDKDDRHQVTLRSELDFLERYLAIEKIRFRDRLKVEMEIDPTCLEAQVPRLILQPLVENSIQHGFARKSSAGLVAIKAQREGGRLFLSVADDGPGIADLASPPREGVGLGNTRARLAHIYGRDHRFELGKADVGGLEVSMELPYETVPRFTTRS